MVTGGLIAHPFEAAPGAAALLSRRGGRRLGRADRVRRAGARAGRVRRKARGARRLSRRRAGGGRARAGAVHGLRLAADGRGRPDALPGDEHAARRRVSRGRAQLLAVELHRWPAGRADRHSGRAVRRRPVADDGDPARALPRRGDARRARRRPPSRTASPAGTSSFRPSGPTRPTPTPTSAGRARPSPACSRTWRPAAGSTTSATIRASTPSAPPTARTTTGSERSSAATTPTTSSTSTTTSRPDGSQTVRLVRNPILCVGARANRSGKHSRTLAWASGVSPLLLFVQSISLARCRTRCCCHADAQARSNLA